MNENEEAQPAVINRYPSATRRCPMCGGLMNLHVDAYAPWTVCGDCSYMERFGKED